VRVRSVFLSTACAVLHFRAVFLWERSLSSTGTEIPRIPDPGTNLGTYVDGKSSEELAGKEVQRGGKEGRGAYWCPWKWDVSAW